MAVIYFLVDLFINTFGITQPTERKRRQAAFFILGLGSLVVLVAAGAFFVVRNAMR